MDRSRTNSVHLRHFGAGFARADYPEASKPSPALAVAVRLKIATLSKSPGRQHFIQARLAVPAIIR